MHILTSEAFISKQESNCLHIIQSEEGNTERITGELNKFTWKCQHLHRKIKTDPFVTHLDSL